MQPPTHMFGFSCCIFMHMAPLMVYVGSRSSSDLAFLVGGLFSGRLSRKATCSVKILLDSGLQILPASKLIPCHTWIMVKWSSLRNVFYTTRSAPSSFYILLVHSFVEEVRQISELSRLMSALVSLMGPCFSTAPWESCVWLFLSLFRYRTSSYLSTRRIAYKSAFLLGVTGMLMVGPL